MSYSGPPVLKKSSPILEISNPRGPNPGKGSVSAYSTPGGSISPRQKIFLGPRSGTFQRPQIAGQEGSYEDNYLSIFISLSYRLMEKENRKAREDARKEYNDTVKVGHCFREVVILSHRVTTG